MAAAGWQLEHDLWRNDMSPLISCDELSAFVTHRPSSVVVIDCSFDLADPSAGWSAFQLGHIHGAAYIHLEDDLSAPRTGLNGRHPLPNHPLKPTRILRAAYLAR